MQNKVKEVALDCFTTEEARRQRRINREIEDQLQVDKAQSRREVKVFISGLDEAGKSTFIKQMRIAHGGGYSDEDKKFIKRLVYQNVIKATQYMIKLIEKLKIPYSDSSNEMKANLFLDLDYETVLEFEEPYLSGLRDIWGDENVRKIFNDEHECNLTDSTKYFLCDLDRLFQPSYLPTKQDILHVRVPTIGISEYPFEFESVIYKLIDFGRVRTERRKWIHHFDGITSVMFLVALSEFSRLEESKMLFLNDITRPWFKNCSFLLFLNKKDLFEEKILRSDLKDYFPEYDGPPRVAIAAREFILKMFVDVNPDSEKIIYSHFTNMLEPVSVRYFFSAVQDTILQANLRTSKSKFVS